MSPDNVACVRRLLAAFNEGDVEAIVAECDPDVEWEEQSIAGVEPVFRGHDGIRRWAGLVMGGEWDTLQGRIDRMEEARDALVASLVIDGEGSSSGARVQMHVYLVLSFRAGKLARREVFQTRAEALEAVGLRG